MEFDDVFSYIGQIGFYQIIAFLTLGGGEFFGVEALVMNFIGGKQEHWCKIPELSGLSFDRQKLIAIPKIKESGSNDWTYSKCDMFPLNYSSYSTIDFLRWNSTHRQLVEDIFPNKDSYVSCSNEWIYGQSLYLSTILSDWDLVCKKTWMVRLTSTIYMFGRFVGAISCGIISDKIGRKLTVVIYLIFKIGGGFMAAYSPNYPVFCIGRFIIAIGTTGSNLAAYVYRKLIYFSFQFYTLFNVIKNKFLYLKFDI